MLTMDTLAEKYKFALNGIELRAREKKATDAQRQADIATQAFEELSKLGTYSPDQRYKMIMLAGDVLLTSLCQSIAEGIAKDRGNLIADVKSMWELAREAAADIGVNVPVTVVMATPADIELATARAYGFN